MSAISITRQRVYCDLLLLLAAVVWGLAFVPQRVATEHIGFFLFNGLRFLLGALVLAPILLRRPRPTRKLIGWAAAAGGVLAAAAAFQQAGLKYTTAGNAAFLTTLYVVLVPVVLLVGWRKPMSWRSWAAALLAAGGAYLLSADSTFHFGYGDRLEVAGAVLWALHIVLVGLAVAQFDAMWFSVGQYLVAGVLSTLLGLGLESSTLPGLAECWWAVGYLGIVSTGVGYTLQAVGQRRAPAADAAVIISMEGVFAALFGFALLGEVLIARQYAGCALILGAVIFVQIRPAAAARQGHLDEARTSRMETTVDHTDSN